MIILFSIVYSALFFWKLSACDANEVNDSTIVGFSLNYFDPLIININFLNKCFGLLISGPQLKVNKLIQYN